MGSLTDKMKSPLAFLFPGSHKEELVAEHIIREHHKGRSLQEILDDSYVKNHLEPEKVNKVLSRQDVIQAVGEDTIAAFQTPSAT